MKFDTMMDISRGLNLKAEAMERNLAGGLDGETGDLMNLSAYDVNRYDADSVASLLLLRGGSHDRTALQGQSTSSVSCCHRPRSHGVPRTRRMNATSCCALSSSTMMNTMPRRRIVTGMFMRANKRRGVSFGSVQVREYERIAGDHPAVRDGPPLGLGWAFRLRATLMVDMYERQRSAARRNCHDAAAAALAAAAAAAAATQGPSTSATPPTPPLSTAEADVPTAMQRQPRQQEAPLSPSRRGSWKMAPLRLDGPARRALLLEYGIPLEEIWEAERQVERTAFDAKDDVWEKIQRMKLSRHRKRSLLAPMDQEGEEVEAEAEEAAVRTANATMTTTAARESSPDRNGSESPPPHKRMKRDDGSASSSTPHKNGDDKCKTKSSELLQQECQPRRGEASFPISVQ